MKYVLINKSSGVETEISHEEAKERISKYYFENVCTYDEMLAEEGVIPMLFSNLIIKAN